LYPDDDNFQRYQVYPNGVDIPHESDPPEQFRRSRLTYITLFLLLVAWPVMSVAFVGDPAKTLKLLADSPIFLIYLPTIIVQWLIFLLIWITVRRERTGLAGLGFKKIRLLDFFYAVAFLLVANLMLSFLALLLAKFGLTIPGEIELMLPKNNFERVLWVILSFTAGVCEETAFRGYLLTRLKILGRGGWVIPVILASITFVMGHSYQGGGGFILLTVYGAMFAVFYIKTGTIWPVIIAHFFQNFSALFFPFQN
jgi:membrane protease YdiL (CAAX protease family)